MQQIVILFIGIVIGVIIGVFVTCLLISSKQNEYINMIMENKYEKDRK